jgi:hypothetical protein
VALTKELVVFLES